MLTSQMGGDSLLARPAAPFALVEELAARLALRGEGGPGGAHFDRLVSACVLGRSEAVREQQQQGGAPAPPGKEESPLKRPRTEPPSPSAPPEAGRSSRFSGAPIQQEQAQGSPASVAAPSVPAPKLADFDDVSGLGAGWEQVPAALLAGFRERPTLLFSAAYKEPLLSGFRGLGAALTGSCPLYVFAVLLSFLEVTIA